MSGSYNSDGSLCSAPLTLPDDKRRVAAMFTDLMPTTNFQEFGSLHDAIHAAIHASMSFMLPPRPAVGTGAQTRPSAIIRGDTSGSRTGTVGDDEVADNRSRSPRPRQDVTGEVLHIRKVESPRLSHRLVSCTILG